MSPITLPAHFDGEHIRLDAPYPLTTKTRLLVVVLPDAQAQDERADWLRVSASGLGRGYADNEIEYSRSLIKEPNPGYTAKP